MQRTPLRLFNDYNYLRLLDLTSNQVVGSSNLSGRAIFTKSANLLAAIGLVNQLRTGTLGLKDKCIGMECIPGEPVNDDARDFFSV